MNVPHSETNDRRAKHLSERQSQCLMLAGEGFSSKEIAQQINLSPSTVDNHIAAAIDRLGAKNRVEAVRFLLEQVNSTHKEASLIEPATGPHQENQRDRFRLNSLPSLGGRPNTLSVRDRLYSILQIAALSVAVCSAIILTIAGVVYVLS